MLRDQSDCVNTVCTIRFIGLPRGFRHVAEMSNRKPLYAWKAPPNVDRERHYEAVAPLDMCVDVTPYPPAHENHIRVHNSGGVRTRGRNVLLDGIKECDVVLVGEQERHRLAHPLAVGDAAADLTPCVILTNKVPVP